MLGLVYLFLPANLNPACRSHRAPTKSTGTPLPSTIKLVAVATLLGATQATATQAHNPMSYREPAYSCATAGDGHSDTVVAALNLNTWRNLPLLPPQDADVWALQAPCCHRPGSWR